MDIKQRIDELKQLDGLNNDAYYWGLCRTYGDYSPEVLRHLQACARAQAAGQNHT